MSTKNKIQITSIECKGTSEPSSDEVYLICQADGGVPLFYPVGIAQLSAHPQSMSPTAPDNVWTLPTGDTALVLNFDHEVLVSLWDSDVDDDLTVSSFLGSYDYTQDNFQSSVTIQTPGKDGYNAYYIVNATKLTT